MLYSRVFGDGLLPSILNSMNFATVMRESMYWVILILFIICSVPTLNANFVARLDCGADLYGGGGSSARS